MSLDPITDYVRRGILSLPPSYWGKPRIASALRALLEQVQVIEDETQNAIAVRTVDGAWLHQLRVLGDIVGQPDTGLSADDYRKAIKARAIANRSTGGVDDLLAVWAVFSAAGMAWEDLPPAKLRLTAESVGTLPMATIFELLRAAKAGGVGLEMLWAPGAGLLFEDEGALALGFGELSSVDRDLGTILGQTPSAQVSGFDLPVSASASWAWPAVAGVGLKTFSTNYPDIASNWFGLPCASFVAANTDRLWEPDDKPLSTPHNGQINLPWSVACAVKVVAAQAVTGIRALWGIGASPSVAYKLLGINWATGLTVFKVVNDAGTEFTVTGAAFPVGVEVVVAHYFDGSSVTVLALDPLSGDISTLIPATALGASGAYAATEKATVGFVDRVGDDLHTDMSLRALLWVNSPSFGLSELKDAMRHLCQPPATSIPGVGGLYSINPSV